MLNFIEERETLIEKVQKLEFCYHLGPEVMKKIILNSAEHEIYPAHKC